MNRIACGLSSAALGAAVMCMATLVLADAGQAGWR